MTNKENGTDEGQRKIEDVDLEGYEIQKQSTNTTKEFLYNKKNHRHGACVKDKGKEIRQHRRKAQEDGRHRGGARKFGQLRKYRKLRTQFSRATA